MDAPASQPIQLDIDEPTARGAYANLGVISYRDTEFILDFVFMQPQAPKAKVVSRVITSPIHAQRLMLALTDNLRRYEAAFGPIKDTNPPVFAQEPAGRVS